MRGWGRKAGNASGQDYGTLTRVALPAHVFLVLCVPVPAPSSPLLIPFSSLKQKRERVGLRGTGVPWPDPIITQSRPHPGSVTKSPLKAMGKLMAHSSLLLKRFQPFNNLCILFGPGTGIQKQQQQ